MGKTRYISFAILLLFVAAFASRISVVYLCSCHDHSHSHIEEHHCCSCPDHVSDCSYHDIFIKDKCCNFHNFVDADFAMLISASESRSERGTLWHVHSAIVLCSALCGVDDPDVEEHIKTTYRYQPLFSQWSGVSDSLRAPPALV